MKRLLIVLALSLVSCGRLDGYQLRKCVSFCGDVESIDYISNAFGYSCRCVNGTYAEIFAIK